MLVIIKNTIRCSQMSMVLICSIPVKYVILLSNHRYCIIESVQLRFNQSINLACRGPQLNIGLPEVMLSDVDTFHVHKINKIVNLY